MADEINAAMAKIEIVEARLCNVERTVLSGSDGRSVVSQNNTADIVEQALNDYKRQVLDKLKIIKESFVSEGKV